MRVIGIDPGTLTVDLCGLDDGAVFLDRAWPTAEALGDATWLPRLLESLAPLDLVGGPSGYGMPVRDVRDLSDEDLRLVHLAASDERGSIGGLRALLRELARSPLPIVLTPGVIHLPTVPAHRKVNRVDLGTADKVCAAALAIHDRMTHHGCSPHEVSCILLELGGAFSAAVAIEAGAIVDGAGGTSGPLGLRAAGALDGEAAFLAGTVPKEMLFRGGAAFIAGVPDLTADALMRLDTPRGRVARDAFVDSAVKAVAAMKVSAPAAAEVVLSGRAARLAPLRAAIATGIASVFPGMAVHVSVGFAAVSDAAQGAALIADGLAGGRFAPIVDALRIRDAHGTVLDHLHVISAADARRRLALS